MPAFDTAYIVRVLLVFVRVSGLLMAAPVFGQQTVPVQVRVLFGALLGYSLAGFVTGPLPEYATQDVGFVVILVMEAVTGLLIGFTARLMFWAVSFAGSIMGYQMVLSLAQSFNPMTGAASNPLGQILSYTFLLLFLLMDGHHFLIQALVHSFEVVPMGGVNVAAAGPSLLEWMGEFFRVSLRLAAPFLVLLFFTDIVLGIFARLIPQANLFTLALPTKLLVGVGVFLVFVQGLVPAFTPIIEQINRMVMELLTAIAPV